MLNNKMFFYKKMDEKEDIRIILGIDISTSCLGLSLVKYSRDSIEVLKLSHVKPKVPKKYKGTEALFLKAKQFKEEYIEKYKDIGITDIIIEEPLPNSQNNNTVTTLLRFNGMISQSIYEATGIVPKYISSFDARKYGFPELVAIRNFNKEDKRYTKEKYIKSLKKNELVLFGEYPFSCQKKYILWNKISEMFPDIEWEYNKKNELKTENFDASDSLVCVLGYINKEKYNDTLPKVIDFKIDNIDNKEVIKYKVSFCEKTFDKILNL